jgi:uncharacterized MAPEG superfamily protein
MVALQTFRQLRKSMSFTTAIALFGLITLMLISTEIMYTYATQGFGFGFSSNRPQPVLSAFGLRLKRTLQNQIESSAYVVPALAAAQFTGLQGHGAAVAALLIVVGRAAFALLYLTGVPFIRVPAFVAATFSSLFLLAQVLLQ